MRYALFLGVLALVVASAVAAADDNLLDDGENKYSPELGPANVDGPVDIEATPTNTADDAAAVDEKATADDDDDDDDLDLARLVGGDDDDDADDDADDDDDVDVSAAATVEPYTVTRRDWDRFLQLQVAFDWRQLMEDIGSSIVGASGAKAIARNYKSTATNVIANEFVLGLYNPARSGDCTRATYKKGYTTWRFGVFFEQSVDAILQYYGTHWFGESTTSNSDNNAVARRKVAATTIRTLFPATTLAAPVWKALPAAIETWRADRKKSGWCDAKCEGFWVKQWANTGKATLTNLLSKAVPTTKAPSILDTCAKRWAKVVTHCTLQEFLDNPCKYSLPCAFGAAKAFALSSIQMVPAQTNTRDSATILHDVVETFACAHATFSAARAMYADNYVECNNNCPKDSYARKFLAALWAVENERLAAEKARIAAQQNSGYIIGVDEGAKQQGYPSCSSIGSICDTCPVSTCMSVGSDMFYGC